MPVRRGARTLVLVLSLMAVMALTAGAPSASAVSADKVTGGQSGLFIPLSNVSKLANAGIWVTPISPAFLTFTSQEGPAIRFPISGGVVESATMLGTVNHAGGMLIQKVDLTDFSVQKELQVTEVKIVNGMTLAGNVFGLVPAPTADLVNGSHSKDPSSGVIHFEADAQINAVNATVLNTYFDTTAFEAGMTLGRVKANIETKKILGL